MGEHIDDTSHEDELDDESGKDDLGMDESEDEHSDNVSEVKNIPIVNDIFNTIEKQDVDLLVFFVLHVLTVDEKTSGFFQDIHTVSKKDIFLSIFPKIILVKLSHPFNAEILKKNKYQTISLPRFYPKITRTTLNISDIENMKNISSPIFDIIPPKKKRFSFYKGWSLPQFSSSIIKLSALFVLLTGVLLSYGLLTKFYVERTLYSIKNLQVSSPDILSEKLKDIRNDLILSKILLFPLKIGNVVIQNSSLTNASQIVSGTYDMIQVGVNFFDVYQGTQEMIAKKGIDGIMFSQLLENIDPLLLSMQKRINNAMTLFQKVTPFDDENLTLQFQKYVEKGKVFQGYFNLFIENRNIIKSILGHEKKKTYMILFQNSDEIRPMGGFIGSVAFIEVFRGKIMKFENKDIYAIEWSLKDFAQKNGIAFEKQAPEGLNKLSDTFGLRDANYFPDIAESSHEIKNFLKNSEYSDIDGIIYINQNVITDVLKMIGPVYFDFAHRDVTSENFSLLFSTLVEAKLTKTHTLSTPKQVLFDFMNVFFEKIKTSQHFERYITLFYESIEKKDIGVYLFNSEENSFLEKIIKNTVNTYQEYQDFNYPIFTSISGNKSDRYMQRKMVKTYTIQPNCDIQTTFEIQQKHTFSINDELGVKNILYDMKVSDAVDMEKMIEIQGKGVNKQYIRVFLPLGAKVTPQKNMTVTEFSNYQQVAFYLNTNTLFESNFTLEYVLENPSCSAYQYTLIKQPGISNYTIDIIKNGNLIQSQYTNKNFIYND